MNVKLLGQVTGLHLSAEEYESNFPRLLCKLFEGVVFPEIHLGDESNGRLVIPIGFSIIIGGSTTIFNILRHESLFAAFPLPLQKGFLDVLYLILHRNPYDVARFECYGDNALDMAHPFTAGFSSSEANSMNEYVRDADMENLNINRLLLDLLGKSREIGSSEYVPVQKRIIRVLGATCTAGISVTNLKDFMQHLKYPSELTVPLLRALKTMMKYNNSVAKAAPGSFFNFGGYGAGIVSEPVQYPFSKECHFFTWFRVESFTDSTYKDGQKMCDHEWRQHIMTIRNSSFAGIDVYIENRILYIAVFENNNVLVRLVKIEERRLSRGVWYHVSIRHGKPRFALLSKDEMTVYIDHQLVFQDSVRFPSSSIGVVEMSVGRNFNGQIGPAYFVNELLSPPCVEAIAKMDASKSVEGVAVGSNANAADLISAVTSSDRKVTNVLSKMETVYHPNRCAYGHALDIHGGRHGRMRSLTHSCRIITASDALASLGGISCLLPLFPRLLIENNSLRTTVASTAALSTSGRQFFFGESACSSGRNRNNSAATDDSTGSGAFSHSNSESSLSNRAHSPHQPSSSCSRPQTGLGSSLPDIQADLDCEGIFDLIALDGFYIDGGEVSDDGAISLLLGIVACYISNNKAYQRELVHTRFIEMIEYALTCISSDIFQGEGDGCVMAIVQLQSLTNEYKLLCDSITKRLLFNFKIWHKGSFSFQSALMSVILSALRAQPQAYIGIVTVDTLLDYMAACYMDGRQRPPVIQAKISSDSIAEKETPLFRPTNHANTSDDSLEQVSSPQKKTSTAKFLDLSDHDMVENSTENSVYTLLDVSSIIFGADADSNFIDVSDLCEGGDPDPLRGRLMTDSSNVIRASAGADDDAGFIPDSSDKNAVPKPPSDEKLTDLSNDSVRNNVAVMEQEIGYVTQEEQKYLRECIQSMIVVLVQSGCSDKETKSFLHFMATCADLVVLNEMAQLLLYLIIDNGAKVIAAVTEVCRGPEEFATFVLHKMIAQPREELRSTGIRILTHFYHSLELLPVTLLTMTMRRKNLNVVARTMDRISMLTGGRGMQRLQECGGLLLMCDLISPHMRQSSELTYSAMLEMLLTKPGSKPLVALEDVSTSSARVATGSFIHDQSRTGTSRSSLLQRAAVFDLSQEHLYDDQSDMINTYVLPSVLQMLPKLPLASYGNCLMNLLGLLKHSSVNRDAFTAEPSWHLSLFGIVSQLVMPIERSRNETSTSSLVAEVNRYIGSVIIPSQSDSEASQENATSSPNKLTAMKNKLPSISTEHDLDMWFSLGMKIYATMLLHCLDYQGGWREVEMALSLSSHRGEERCLSQAILSNIVAELSVSMRVRYKDLQKLVKSKSINDIHKFKDRLENILSLLLSAVQFSLGDIACSSSGVPHFSVGQLRVRCINEIGEEMSMKASLPSSLSAEPLSAAAILEMAEERLRNRYRSVSYSNVSSPGEMSQAMLVSFDHVWTSPGESILLPLDRVGQARYKLSDTLNPLERQQDLDSGNLTLILQSMRLFDEVFWPSETEAIRNAHMLRFLKDKFNKELYSPSQSSSDSVTKTENLTLFSGVMRSCLYICQTLSPLVDLATLNVKRMRVLFEGSGNLSRERPITTPVDDWMVAAVLHVTLNLQRVSRALQPIYLLLGITEELAVSCSGKENISTDRMFSENAAISKAMENADLSAKIEIFFATIPAQNLLLYIKNSVELLADAFTSHKDVLNRALSSSALELLMQFIERYASYNERNNELEVVTNRNSQHSQLEVDNLTISVSRTESFASTTSSDAGSVDSGGDDKSNSGNSDSLPSPIPLSSHSPIPAVEPEMNKYLMVAILRLLRDDYLWSDLLRSPKIVMSVSALEGHEVDCGKAFLSNVSSLRYILEKNTLAPRQKLHEEMRELKDLAGTLSAVMTAQEKARLSLKRSVEAPQVKTVAACWLDCIRTFDASWSPFFSDEPVQDGKASAKMSNHHDRRMRHMLMVRTRSSADHTSSAYMEGKKQDQNQYESEGQIAREKERVALDESQSFLKLNLTTKVGASNSAEVNWGDETESDIDDDDDKTDAATTGSEAPATSPMGPLGLAGKTVDIIAGISKSVAASNIDRRPLWAQSFYWATDEKFQYMIDASQIQVEQTVSGVLLLSNKCLYFHPKKQIGGLGGQTKAFKDRRWHLDRLVDVHARRYLLQNCAIELFFADSPEIFFAFASTQILQKFYRILRKQHAPLLNNTSKSLSPQQVFLSSSWTDLWRRRLISNFEYIMRLNMIAGRSYNDITQYPVFPWIIADYTSKHLDLTNPATFRDLAKPVGALNPSRLIEILERYNSIDDDIGVPKFMYGSHYSSAGVVIHYMIRQEPYTTLAVSLQGGRFDCPDRNFFDLQSTWSGVNSSLSDVKELIPEMFCCPEILLNSNKLPLGELQDGGATVNDVKLPPWAKDSFDFVRLNREALESDHVSDHLHEWIDLIFGYKQRGAEAEKSYNLFYYLTYENCAININNIEDPLEREATKSQVTHFGQTPSQLLPKEPHPRRLPRMECMIPLCGDIQNLSNLTIYTPPKQIAADGGHGAAIAIQCSSDRLVIFHADFSLCYYKWSSFPDGIGNPFTLKPDRGRVLTCAPLCLSEDVLKRKSYVPLTLAQQPLLTSLLPPEQDFAPVPDVAQPFRGNILSPASEASTEQQRSRTFSDSLNLTSIYGGGESSADADKATSQKMSSISGMFNLNKIKSVFSGAASTPSPQSNNSRRLSGRMDAGIFSTARGGADVGAPPTQKSPYHSNETSSHNSGINNKIYGCSKRLPIMSHKNVALSVGELGHGRIISVGYWDNSLKVHALDSHREISSNSNGHNGAITCVELGSQGLPTIVTGGADGTCRVWVLENASLASAFSKDLGGADGDSIDPVLACLHVLWGHHSPITAISYATDLDILFSASESGLLCVHTVSKGHFVHSITHTEGASVDVVLASSQGYLVAHSWTDLQLHLFWMNGQHLFSDVSESKIEALAVNGPGNVLMCGCSNGTIVLRALWNLEMTHVIDLSAHQGVKSLTFTDDHQFLLIGSEDGSFSIGTDPDIRWSIAMNKSIPNPYI